MGGLERDSQLRLRTAPSFSALCYATEQEEEIKTYLTLPIHIIGFALKASWTQKS